MAAADRPVESVTIYAVKGDVELDVGGRRVRLTNLDKIFFPAIGGTKRDATGRW